MEPKYQKVKWWNWLFGVVPVVAYIIISIIVVNALQKSPQNGGWSIILYGVIPQIALISIVVNSIYLRKMKYAFENEKRIIVGLIIVDVIITALCITAFMGHPEITIFWWYWFN